MGVGEESCEFTEMEEGGAATRHRPVAFRSHSLSVTMARGFTKLGGLLLWAVALSMPGF